jgi:hypothetical protein
VSVECPSDLKRRYLEGRVIPFLGAGLSMSVEWTEGGVNKRGPSWRELVDQAARILGFRDPELLRLRGTDLQILEYFQIAKYGNFAELTNWLYAEMRPPDDALRLSPIHAKLASLSRCNVFYTTNYDDFIERSLRLHGREPNAIAIEAHMGRTPVKSGSTCDVVKFHGDLNHPREMVLSESHYERRLKLDSPMDYKLRADLLGRVLLFLGYSFRDWNVSYLFRLVNDQLERLPDSRSGHRAYITVPNPSTFETRLFEARNIEVISIDGADHTRDIASLLDELVR